MQQILVHFVPNISALGNTLGAGCLAIICGFISWHLIEKPALHLKKIDRWPRFILFSKKI
jgi:peptidoglycan/LPS O-acetylase OafA/YrhL